MRYKLEKEIAGSYEYPVRTLYGYMAGKSCLFVWSSQHGVYIHKTYNMLDSLNFQIDTFDYSRIYWFQNITLSAIDAVSDILVLSREEK